MNVFPLRSPFLTWVPAILLSAAFAPLAMGDCCGGGGGGAGFASGGGGFSQGSPQGMFGGSPHRVILLKNNSPSQTVSFNLGGKTVQLAAGESKRRDFGGTDANTGAIPPLPGEDATSSLTESTGSTGTTPSVKVTEEDQCPPRYVYDSTGTTGWEIAENSYTLAIPAMGSVTDGPRTRTPVSARGESSAPLPSTVDYADFGFGGAVLTPGGVSLDSSDRIAVSNTGIVVAASLGNSTDGGRGRLGYIIPAPTGTGSVYQFYERVSYAVRGVDLSATTYSTGSGTGSLTRYKTVNGLAMLTQTSTTVLTFSF